MSIKPKNIHKLFTKCNYYKNLKRSSLYPNEFGLIKLDNSDLEDKCKEIDINLYTNHPRRQGGRPSNIYYYKNSQPNYYIEGIGKMYNNKLLNKKYIICLIILILYIIYSLFYYI